MLNKKGVQAMHQEDKLPTRRNLHMHWRASAYVCTAAVAVAATAVGSVRVLRGKRDGIAPHHHRRRAHVPIAVRQGVIGAEHARQVHHTRDQQHTRTNRMQVPGPPQSPVLWLAVFANPYRP